MVGKDPYNLLDWESTDKTEEYVPSHEDIRCKGCGKSPKEIKSIIHSARCEDMTPEQFVEECEGTYNSRTGMFYCDGCYIEAGMPLGKA